MKRALAVLTLVGLAVVTSSIVNAGKPAPPPPPPPPAATGTIFFKSGAQMMAMNPDGSGKVAVLPANVPPGHPLNPDGELQWLNGAPCDQVHGSNTKLDRWYLGTAHTHTFDKIIRADGTEYIPSDPRTYYHYDIFAYRTNPANRNEVIVVQVTDFFGLVWNQGASAYWSNDSNESDTASYIGSWARDIRGCCYLDDNDDFVLDYSLNPDLQYSPVTLHYHLPLTASEIQAAWEVDADLAIRPDNPGDFNSILTFAPGGAETAPDGLTYASCESGTIVVRQSATGALVRTVWNSNGSTNPKYPGAAVWSRDGNTILFHNGGNSAYTSVGGYWKVSATGGTPTQLVQEDYKGYKWTWYTNGVWSPDSNYTSIRYNLQDSSKGPSQYTFDIMRLPASGGTLTNLTADTTANVDLFRWVSNTVAP